jgi:2-amino-4-hydroxy-6-hydroxymethyldihydropteridine diphosphokinase
MILLGSNEGNRSECLLSAMQALRGRAGAILQSSRIYESAAWGGAMGGRYLNQALLLATALSPMDLLRDVLAIEAQLGRVRTAVRYAPRCIDIDILLYEDLVVAMPELELPHPRLHLRRFALLPTVEIAPDWVHPLLHKTMRQLLWECGDSGVVSVVGANMW